MGLTGQCTRHRRRSRFLFLVAGALYHVAKLMENKRALLGAAMSRPHTTHSISRMKEEKQEKKKAKIIFKCRL